MNICARTLALLLFAALPAALAAAATPADPAAPPLLRVSVDPRVELLSVVFRLAGNPEYGQGRIPSYVRDVEAHFGPHRDHPVVNLAKQLRASRGVSYDAVMSYAIHLTTDWEPVLSFSPLPPTLDARWTPELAAEFRGKLADFARAAAFEGFYSAHQPLCQGAVAGMERVLKDHADLGWFDRFFGARPGAQFRVALGLLNGGSCYGARIRPSEGPEQLYCVLGVWAADAAGQPRFDRTMLPTVAHEFCHSYVNPLVYAHEEELRQAGETLYPAVAHAMQQQAYGNWLTLIHESLVRASVVRYQLATEGESAAEREILGQIERSFLWTRELGQLLATYEGQHDRYPDFTTFFPKVIEFFNQQAPIFAQKVREQEQRAPKTVSLVPPNGAQDVDPALAAISVTFDRPMAGGYSFVGGGPRYPPSTGSPSFDSTGRVVTLPVKLEPNHTYELWLNRNQIQGFRSQEGVPLESVHYKFRTGAIR